MHATAQGVIAGANMVLVDFHPSPAQALVDGPQALKLPELPISLKMFGLPKKLTRGGWIWRNVTGLNEGEPAVSVS